MIDKDLKQHVQNALDWEPSVDATDVGVSVDEGVVTLRGNVASYSDTEIAQAALAALKWNTVVPDDRVTLVVKDGWITLAGTLDWQYQKDAASRAVRDLTGVKGVTNEIHVTPVVKTTDVRDKIEAAFKRSAAIDARRVNVTAHDGTVILSGNVHSWAERQEADRAAWAAPGVTHVDDRLTVVP